MAAHHHTSSSTVDEIAAANAVHTDAAAHAHADGDFSHPAPLWMLFAVFFALLFLTWLTVWQSTLDLGGIEIYVSLAVATLKAGLVIFIFMHMLWDKLLNAIIFFSSLIFVSLFVGITLMDATSYKDTIIDADTLADSLPKSVVDGTEADPTLDLESVDNLD